KHEGVVENVLSDEGDVDDAGDLGVSVKHPRRVDLLQHGHKVSHNPRTLQHTE
ncbi:hypothetical protein BC834DRAFT_810589, partial [Gloeopeniophorella convolvens]